jgi:glycerol-3-phosphate dehydrogenase (NAD(P)+)
MNVAILGVGAFAIALAKVLDRRDHAVTVWCHDEALGLKISKSRRSEYLPGIPLSKKIEVTHDLKKAVSNRPIVVCVVASSFVRSTIKAALPFLDPRVTIVNGAKGIEMETLETLEQIYGEVLSPEISRRVVFLSGPTFAKELATEHPTSAVVASRDPESAALIQREFSMEYFRLYTSDDVIGVELGGTLKNVYAIGAGISDGLGFGHNTRAALITRGLDEMTRLGVKLGAKAETFSGLAGLGDLVLTCAGDLSRNRHVGLALGRGRKLHDILAEMKSVAEGVKTAKALHQLAAKAGVEMPIAEAIYRVLYEGKEARQALQELMTRELRPERRL